MVLGAISIAEHVHRVAERYPVWVALHTDHCQADKLDAFVKKISAVSIAGFRRYKEAAVYNHSMAKDVIHISEAEAASDFAGTRACWREGHHRE
jgi:fructose/tagatose bisphosphate aldolase